VPGRQSGAIAVAGRPFSGLSCAASITPSVKTRTTGRARAIALSRMTGWCPAV